MNLKDYQAWAITKKADDLTEREAKLTWALGLVDETIEVCHNFHYGFSNPLEIFDELGDVAWYAAVLADAYHIPLETLRLDWMLLGAGIAQSSHMETLAKTIGEMVKKNISHGHEMPLFALRMNLGRLLGAIDQMVNGLSQVESGLAEVLQLNHDKLEERYPGGFDSAASQRRYEEAPDGEG
jgi:NTP pyrophosphatase (non-canonical NTP hydrolase)